MAIERVREYFKQFGIDSKIQEFDTSSATVDLAAEALGCAPERIAKTLAFKVGEKLFWSLPQATPGSITRSSRRSLKSGQVCLRRMKQSPW